LCTQMAPVISELPLILNFLFQPTRANLMLHRQAYIVLTIYKASRNCDCLLGHNFGDEHNAPSVFIAFLATDVEAEVYLIEIRMKGDGKRPE
jgi:hypothetical protein